MQFVTSIFVQVRSGQQDELIQKLEEFRQRGQHTFPGTVARYVVESETNPGQIQISLTWRGTIMPSEVQQEQAIGEFRRTLADVLDWDTAQYNKGKVLMHT